MTSAPGWARRRSWSSACPSCCACQVRESAVSSRGMKLATSRPWLLPRWSRRWTRRRPRQRGCAASLTILRFPVRSGQDCTAPYCCTHGRGTLIRAGPNFCGTAYGDSDPDDPAGLPSYRRLVEEDSRSEHAQTPVCVSSSRVAERRPAAAPDRVVAVLAHRPAQARRPHRHPEGHRRPRHPERRHLAQRRMGRPRPRTPLSRSFVARPVTLPQSAHVAGATPEPQTAS